MKDWTMHERFGLIEITFNTPAGIKSGNKFLYGGKTNIESCGAVFESDALSRLMNFAITEDITIEA